MRILHRENGLYPLTGKSRGKRAYPYPGMPIERLSKRVQYRITGILPPIREISDDPDYLMNPVRVMNHVKIQFLSDILSCYKKSYGYSGSFYRWTLWIRQHADARSDSSGFHPPWMHSSKINPSLFIRADPLCPGWYQRLWEWENAFESH